MRKHIHFIFLLLRLLYSECALSCQKHCNTTFTSYEIYYLNTTAPVGYTIKSPGYYYLTDDLIVSPKEDNYVGIFISTNNVTLDLNSHTILVTTTSNTPAGNLYGIQVAAGAKNITIKNGTIDGMDLTKNSLHAGIYISGTQTLPNKNISLESIAILNCKTYGIYLNFCDAVLCNDISISGITSNTALNFPAGLYLSSCTRGIVKDSSFEATFQVNNAQGTAYGLYATACSNYKFKHISTSNCTISSINTNERSGVYGLYLSQCQALHCTDIKAIRNQHVGKNTNSSTGNECCGIYLNNTTGCIFERCITNNNTGGYQYGSNFTCSTYGFKLTNSSDGNTFTACTASSNVGAADCAGIFIGQSGNNVFESCLSLNNSSTKTNFGSRFAFGITTTFGANNIFKNCKITGNRVAERISNKGYGIALRSELSSKIKSCELNFNGPGNDTAAGEAYGIACLGHCNKCTIEYNSVAGNLAATKRYGFKDFSDNCKTFLWGNVVYGHGDTLTGGTTLTDSGAMNYFLKFSTAGTANPDVRKIIREAFNSTIGDVSNNANERDWFNYAINDN